MSLGLWQNFGDGKPIDDQRAILRRAFDLGITQIARAARQADDRHRQLEHLREVGRAVQRIKLSALEADRLESVGQALSPRWRSADQNALGILLVGVESPPKCKALVGESQAGQVLAKATLSAKLS